MYDILNNCPLDAGPVLHNFSMWEQERNIVSPAIYILAAETALNYAQRMPRWPNEYTAYEYLVKGISMGGVTNTRIITPFIKRLLSGQRISEAVKLLASFEKHTTIRDPVILNMVLNGCVQLNMNSLAKDLLNEFKSSGDTVSYNTLMKGLSQCSAQSAMQEALNFLEEMKRTNVKANVITYNTAMLVACRSRQFRKHQVLFDLLADMQCMGIEADKFTCSTVIKGLLIERNKCSVEFKLRYRALLQAVWKLGSLEKSHMKRSFTEAILNLASSSGDIGVCREAYDQIVSQFGGQENFSSRFPNLDPPKPQEQVCAPLPRSTRPNFRHHCM